VMASCAWVAFGTDIGFGWRYAAIVVLSTVGGLIPGALFATAPFYAPSPAAVSTTVGLVQQGSGAGQILLPPLIAALAQYSGGWTLTWVATGLAAMMTVATGLGIRRYDAGRRR
ncbi:MAG: MFS transporter, partial [Burkholderiaceae bacterium]|nr:MFS transporter [Burkholderiaceae bacterium]